MKLKAYCIACQVAVVACDQNRTHTVTVVCVTKTGPVLVFREGVKKTLLNGKFHSFFVATFPF